MRKFMQGFLRAENGATAIEYSLIAAMIACVIVGSVMGLGQGVVGVLYNKIQAAFQ